MPDFYDLPSIKKEDLISQKNKELLEDPSFAKTDQPVLWQQAHGLVEKRSKYYQHLATKLQLEHVDSLPYKINDSHSLANKVGSENLSKLLFFPYTEGKELVIATPDPFKVQEMVENTLPFLVKRPESISVKICSLSVLRKALQQSSYVVTNQQAENRLIIRNPGLSSHNVFSKGYNPILGGMLLGLLALTIINPYLSFLSMYIFINIFYFLLNPVKFFISLGGILIKVPKFTPHTLDSIPEEDLPMYTVLVPLKNEASVVKKLISNLRKIKYPADKLDIKITLEVDDYETIAAIENEIDFNNDHAADTAMFEIVKVPTGELSTKPRSLNFALQFARGTICVIYDAEDKPDPYQLKTAYHTLIDKKLDTLCVQGKLNFYNSRKNLLTRFFTIEYSFWFDILLPGLQHWNIPIPLGGTSNHFLTESLRKIGMWDPYNVTEDADLGWRLSRLGYSTTMMNSYTYEEASSQLWSWIKQRTRWQKGFLTTILVHLKSPQKIRRELGNWGFYSSALLFTTNFFLPVINPMLWILFLLWYVPLAFGIQLINFPVPHWLEIVGAINLFFGNGVYMLTNAVGVMKIKRYDLLWMIPLLPLYWFLLSFASYRAIWQVFTNPYGWEKTTHGTT